MKSKFNYKTDAIIWEYDVIEISMASRTWLYDVIEMSTTSSIWVYNVTKLIKKQNKIVERSSFKLRWSCKMDYCWSYTIRTLVKDTQKNLLSKEIKCFAKYGKENQALTMQAKNKPPCVSPQPGHQILYQLKKLQMCENPQFSLL